MRAHDARRPTAALVMCAGLAAGFAAATASAQGRVPRLEIGGEVAGVGLENDEGRLAGSPGLGARIDVHLTPRIALESRLTLFPTHASVRYQTQGGRTLHFAGGVGGTFIRARSWSLYGDVLPGVLHFSAANTGFTTSVTTAPGTGEQVTVIDDVIGPSTHFDLHTGIGVDLFPARRLVMRFEFGNETYVTPGVSVPSSPPPGAQSYLSLLLPATVVNTWHMSAGIAYGFGRLSDRVRPVETSRWEFGTQSGYTWATSVLGSADMRSHPAVGGFLSYRLTDHVSADGAVTASVLDSRDTSPFDGGRTVQALGGLKVGVREGRVGVFGKVRAGVHRQSRVLKSLVSQPFVVGHGPLTNLAIDVGGVVEIYLRRGLLLRLDAGDTVSVFRATTFVHDGEAVNLPAPRDTDSIQMTVGLGWRFGG